MAKWVGYERFCPLAKALDIVGERWSLLIVQELSFSPQRYNQLKRKLPGIGSNILATRLAKLEEHDIVSRLPEETGQGVRYGLTERGHGLTSALAELRKWGIKEQLMIESEMEEATYDVSYGIPNTATIVESYQWQVDDTVITLEISGTVLKQTKGPATDPAVTLSTTSRWIQKLAAGKTDWEKGRASGAVQVVGTDEAWQRMLLATVQPGADINVVGLLTKTT